MTTTISESERDGRQPLTRSRVVAGAIAFADEHGVAALSMRKLAAELGFEVMSLYNHIANKDDLLDGMLDAVVADIALPVADPADWKTSLRASSLSAHQVLVAHPWACEQWWKRMPGPEHNRYTDAILAALTVGGLPEPVVYHGYHAVVMHVVGFTQQGLNFVDTDDLEEKAADFIASFDSASMPYFARHVEQHLDGSQDDASGFEFVLDLILDGLDTAER